MSVIIAFDSETQTITSISRSFSGDLILNRTYNNVDIITIGKGACQNGLIRSLDASKTIIERIKSEAFLICKNLVSLKLPSTVISFETNSFCGTGLTNFTVPKDTINFAGSVVNQSPNLNELFVEEGNKNFASKDNFIFTKDFSVLIRAPINARYFDIPYFKTLKGINGFAFSGCKMRKFVAEASLTNIYSLGFHACYSLKKIDLYLSNITQLHSQTFWSTNSIETLILPKNLMIIRANSFQDFPKLKDLIIPENLTTIESNAFGNLKSITNIYLLCNHQSSFESKHILSSIIGTRQNVFVHAPSNYEGTLFGGFQVQKDLHDAIATLILKNKICTRQSGRAPNKLFIFLILVVS